MDICLSCLRHLPSHVGGCPQCADYRIAAETPAASRCVRCLKHNPAFDRSYAPFLYQDAISYLITSLKFGANYKNARLLGHLMADYLNTHATRPDAIIPIPLHTSRYRERGFNQSIEIARTIADHLNLPLDLTSCIRHRDTQHQLALPAHKRRQNIKHAFSVVKPIAAHHVAIVDDVMTTGSTTHELAAVLKNAGVQHIDVWVCARA